MTKAIKISARSVISIFIIIFCSFALSSCSGGKGGDSFTQGKIEDPLLSKLNDMVKTGDNLSKGDAVKNLKVINTKEAAWILGNIILNDPDEDWRQAAVYALSSYEKSADPEALKYLIKAALSDKSEKVRNAAVIAIGASKLEQAPDALKTLLNKGDENVKALSALYIGIIGGEENDEGVKTILKDLVKNDKDPKVRANAASGLAYFKAKDIPSVLSAALKDGDVSVRSAASSAIYTLSYYNVRDEVIVPDIVTALDDEDYRVRYNAASILGYYGTRSAKDALALKLNDIFSSVRDSAGAALEKMGFSKNAADYGITTLSQDSIISELARLSRKDDETVNLAAIAELGRIKDKKSVDELINLLNSDNKGIRLAAVYALGDYSGPKDKRAIDPLIKILEKDEDADVRGAAASILDDFGENSMVMYPLTAALKNDGSKSVRNSILYTLKYMEEQSLIEPIADVIKNDPDIDVRGNACFALGGFKSANAVNILINTVEDGGLSYIRARAAESLSDYYGAKDPRAVEPLKKALRDEFPVVRQAAAKSLYSLGDKGVTDNVINAVKEEKYPLVRIELIKALGVIDNGSGMGIFIDILRKSRLIEERVTIVGALGSLNNPESIPPLIDSLQNDPSDKVRARAASALYGFNDARILSPLINIMLNDKSENVRFEAAKTLNYVRDRSAFNSFMAVMNKKDESTRIVGEAVSAIGNMQDPRAVDPLIKLYGSTGYTDIDVKIIYALSNLKDTKALPIYISGMKSGDKNTREASAKALENVAPYLTANPEIVDVLIDGLKDGSPDVRQVSARALGEYRDVKAKDSLIAALSDVNKSVRYYSATSLGRLGAEESASMIFPLLKDDDTKYSAEQALKMLGFSENDIKAGRPSGVDYISELITKAKNADWSTSYYAFNDLGNMTTKRALDELLNMLNNPAGIGALDYLVSALANYKGPRDERVYESFVRILNSSPDENLRRPIAAYFAYLKDKRAVDILINVMKNDSADSVKSSAASSLGNLSDPKAVEALLEALNSENYSLRSSSASALGNIYKVSGDPRITDNLIKLLSDKEYGVVTSSVYALGNTEDKRAIGPLKNLLRDKNESVRSAAENTLKKLGVSDEEIAGAGLSDLELFNEYVENIKNSPYYWNRTLREKIITLAKTVSPAPVISEEAEKYMAQAKVAFDMAKSQEGYLDAIEKYKKAATMAPWWAGSYFNLAMVQHKARLFDEAKENFEIYLFASPDAEDAGAVRQKVYEIDYVKERIKQSEELVQKGYIYIQANDFHSAITKFEEALRLDPDSAWAHYELGYSFSSLDKFDEAIKEFKEAIRLNSKELQFYLSLGYAYGRREDIDMSIETYEQGLSQDPYGKNRIYVLLNLAHKYKSKGDYKKSLNLYEQASWSSEDHPDKSKIQGWINEVKPYQ